MKLPEENWIDSQWVTVAMIAATFVLIYWGLK
jgi:hypothetical protein